VYPLPLGAEFIRDLRIKALDLSGLVRKSALQVHCTCPSWGQSSYETCLFVQICTTNIVYLLLIKVKFILDLLVVLNCD
jgi:hypothetical protein